jgi:hypothetical protein
MYFIKKYPECWAVFDDVTGGSRKLSQEDIIRLKNEFPPLQDDQVLTLCSERIRSLPATVRDQYNGN